VPLALKRFTIHRAPNVLTLVLKRFEYVHSHGGKLVKTVAFPEVLDLSRFMSRPDPTAVYRLHGVLVHSGHSTHGGHYYSFVRGATGVWHCMDDSSVTQVSMHTVLQQKAYLLFYSRITDVPRPAAAAAAAPSAAAVAAPVDRAAEEAQPRIAKRVHAAPEPIAVLPAAVRPTPRGLHGPFRDAAAPAVAPPIPEAVAAAAAADVTRIRHAHSRSVRVPVFREEPLDLVRSAAPLCLTHC
jgi:ubiquitin carboxyl-terminal hydrolase 36/42